MYFTIFRKLGNIDKLVNARRCQRRFRTLNHFATATAACVLIQPYLSGNKSHERQNRASLSPMTATKMSATPAGAGFFFCF